MTSQSFFVFLRIFQLLSRLSTYYFPLSEPRDGFHSFPIFFEIFSQISFGSQLVFKLFVLLVKIVYFRVFKMDERLNWVQEFFVFRSDICTSTLVINAFIIRFCVCSRIIRVLIWLIRQLRMLHLHTLKPKTFSLIYSYDSLYNFQNSRDLSSLFSIEFQGL